MSLSNEQDISNIYNESDGSCTWRKGVRASGYDFGAGRELEIVAGCGLSLVINWCTSAKEESRCAQCILQV